MDTIGKAQQSDDAAFLELFAAHHLPLFRFAYRLTGSVEDAEDIVQTCFLTLLRPDSSYDAARTAVRTYLFGVVRNLALKRLRQKEISGRDNIEVADRQSPEREVLRAELGNLVAKAVMELPLIQREVLVLAHYQQLQLSEIAQILNLEVGAVKSRLQRARASLKEKLATYVAGEEKRA